jgi:hypothetical protein
MALSKAKFNPGSRHAGLAGVMHSYIDTGDSLATIKGSGYFNGVADLIETNDVAVIVGSDGANFIRLAKNATTKVVTTTSAVAFA